MPGRIEAAVRYSDAGQLVIGSGVGEVPFGLEGWLGIAYLVIGQPERWVEWCRARLRRSRDTHGVTRTFLVLALTFAGWGEEARSAANGVIDAAEATCNPWALSLALYAYGRAFRDADPAGARDAASRGLVIAQDSGNRFTESLLAGTVSRLEAEHGDPLAALDYITLAIRNYHDAGNTTGMCTALGILAALFDQLGRHQPAAAMAGFALSPLTAAGLPEMNTAIAHLGEVLGDQTYESLARKGETMTIAAIAAYAYDQIDQARAELNTLVELRESRVQRESGTASSQSPSAVCSAKTRYTVARLTPRVLAIVLADSPLACIRRANAAFLSSSALGRPMCCPRARRAWRAAARRSRP